MKCDRIIAAIQTLQEAISHKFDGGSGASIILTSDEVSLDGPDGEILLDNGTNLELAKLLETK